MKPTSFDLPTAYQRLRAERGLVPDAEQERAVAALQALGESLLSARGWSWRRTTELDGAYLHGGVGCGKTMLMDLFCAQLPQELILRLHFQHFMRLVHEQLQRHSGKKNPLRAVVEGLLPIRLLAIDEFYVEDIADAMILGNLLAALARADIKLVLTSNCAPNKLYPNGLQRSRLLPAIARLQQLRQLAFSAVTDYRQLLLRSSPKLLVPHDEAAQQRLRQLFYRYSGEQPKPGELEVLGRKVHYQGLARRIVWFSFADICQSVRASADYIQLARDFDVFLLSEVPELGHDPSSDNAARRLVALVDELYDRSKSLVLSAAAQPEMLYRGHALSAIFERTSSRLQAMTSASAEQSNAYAPR